MFIVFTNFKVKTDFDPNNAITIDKGAWKAYGTDLCTQDWLEIYQLFQDGSEELVGRYCSTSSPGPVVSLQKVALGLRVNFYTDNANVSSGFMGQYTFFEEKSAFGGKNNELFF